MLGRLKSPALPPVELRWHEYVVAVKCDADGFEFGVADLAASVGDGPDGGLPSARLLEPGKRAKSWSPHRERKPLVTLRRLMKTKRLKPILASRLRKRMPRRLVGHNFIIASLRRSSSARYGRSVLSLSRSARLPMAMAQSKIRFII